MSYANQHSFYASWLPRFPPSFPAKTGKPDTRWSVFVSGVQIKRIQETARKATKTARNRLI